MKSLFEKNEIKITIEALSLCAGDCAGCFLTQEMRTQTKLWEDKKFDRLGLFLKKYLDWLSQKRKIDEINLTFGQGDYLQLKKEQIEKILNYAFDWTSKSAFLFFTASCVTNKERLIDNADLFYDLSTKNKVPLIFDVVLSASKVTGAYLPFYEHNFNYLANKFGYFDLNLNMGTDIVQKITPSWFKNFILTNKIGYVTINYIPTKIIDKKTNNDIIKWLIELMNISKGEDYKLNYVVVLKKQIEAYNNLPQNDFLKNELSRGVQNIFIDFYGNLFLQREGIGDFGLTERNNYKPIFNVFDDDFVLFEKRIEDYLSDLVKKEFKNYQKDSGCFSCDYKMACLASIGSNFKNVIGDANEGCELKLFDLFKAVDDFSFNQDLKQCPTFCQKGLSLDESRINTSHLVDTEKADFYSGVNFR